MSWLANWGQLVFPARLELYGFVINAKRWVIGQESVPNMGLLSYQCT